MADGIENPSSIWSLHAEGKWIVGAGHSLYQLDEATSATSHIYNGYDLAADVPPCLYFSRDRMLKRWDPVTAQWNRVYTHPVDIERLYSSNGKWLLYSNGLITVMSDAFQVISERTMNIVGDMLLKHPEIPTAFLAHPDCYYVGTRDGRLFRYAY